MNIFEAFNNQNGFEDDFKNDYSLTPILVALLGEHDPTDAEKLDIYTVITFVENRITTLLGREQIE
jgi:hypothetical protein